MKRSHLFGPFTESDVALHVASILSVSKINIYEFSLGFGGCVHFNSIDFIIIIISTEFYFVDY